MGDREICVNDLDRLDGLLNLRIDGTWKMHVLAFRMVPEYFEDRWCPEDLLALGSEKQTAHNSAWTKRRTVQSMAKRGTIVQTMYR